MMVLAVVPTAGEERNANWIAQLLRWRSSRDLDLLLLLRQLLSFLTQQLTVYANLNHSFYKFNLLISQTGEITSSYLTLLTRKKSASNLSLSRSSNASSRLPPTRLAQIFVPPAQSKYKEELIFIPKKELDGSFFHIPCLLQYSRKKPDTNKFLFYFHGNAEDIFNSTSNLEVLRNSLPVRISYFI
jgi:hypothetical protein